MAVNPWTFTGESVSLGQPGGTVTLVQGSAFCISGRSGDILPGTPQGLFFRDARLISRFELRVNGQAPEPLAATTTDPFSAVFAGRTFPQHGHADSHLMVFRSRFVGRGMREDVSIRNFGTEAAYCSVEWRVGADFADLFEVKEGRASDAGDVEEHAEPARRELVYRVRRGTIRRGVRLSFSTDVQMHGDIVTLEVIVPSGGQWSTCVLVTPTLDDEVVEPRYKCGAAVERAAPAERLRKWRQHAPIVSSAHDGLAAAVVRSVDDLGALRIVDPEHPERAVIAAGAPWFMTLFGRDSLITSWMALLVDPDLALGVLQTLARFQGEEVDPRYDEEPGKILHEMRFGETAALSLGGGRIYYGTADATPLFVMMLGELRRWGLAHEVVDQLLPAADRALDWIQSYGDRDGDGYVEYQRATDRGLHNQGWKDSLDGIRFASGELPRPPIALVEVQAYVYGAYLARAHFADEDGDVAMAGRYRALAADLKRRFNEDFWLDDRGWFAMGLDHAKRPIDALASNMGHCLWAGIVDEDRAAVVAKRLLSDEMFSGWGVRTLGTSMQGYNPISYHCGSVWPHDNAMLAAGLMRYGFVTEAQRVVMGMLDAASLQSGRLPELFSGLSRAEFPTIVSYPTSCSPQAWASASPLSFIRTLLRFDPWIPHGKLWLSPALPGAIPYLRVDRIPLAGSKVTVEVNDGDVKVAGLPPHIEVVTEPRHPLTAS